MTVITVLAKVGMFCQTLRDVNFGLFFDRIASFTISTLMALVMDEWVVNHIRFIEVVILIDIEMRQVNYEENGWLERG